MSVLRTVITVKKDDMDTGEVADVGAENLGEVAGPQSPDSPGVILPTKQRMSRPMALAVAVVAVALGISFALVIMRTTNVVAMFAVSAVVLIIVQSAVSFAYEGRRFAIDRLATTVVYVMFFGAVAPLASLLFTALSQGISRIDLAFINNNSQGISDASVAGGVGHAIWGTVEITATTALISVPLGVLTAVYLTEYGKGPFSRIVTFLVDIMTGIPSIVAGLFAVAIMTTIVRDAGYRSGFVGAVALVVLMTPIVVRNTEEMLRLVPNELREASYALGVPKWRTIIKVVLRTSTAGIISGIVIAIARVIGESAPLLITAMTTDYFNYDLFSGYMMTLPVYVYIAYKQGRFLDAWGAALILIIVVVVLNLVARLIARVYAPKAEK